MRDIKFKVWDNQSKEMLQNPELIFNENVDLNGQLNAFEDNNCILLQYTGLIDMNGIEVYEGDILQDYNNKSILGVISFLDGSWKCESYSFTEISSPKTLFVVAGNIYESKEASNE